VTLVLIVVIIVVAVVAYIMVNRAANGGGGKKRSLLQRSVLDDLQMNTARAIEISTEATQARQHPRTPDIEVSSPLPLSRRRLNKARGVGVPPNHDVELSARKRLVVGWQGVDPTGSDD
jgi:syntaxin 1B/2/3